MQLVLIFCFNSIFVIKMAFFAIISYLESGEVTHGIYAMGSDK